MKLALHQGPVLKDNMHRVWRVEMIRRRVAVVGTMARPGCKAVKLSSCRSTSWE